MATSILQGRRNRARSSFDLRSTVWRLQKLSFSPFRGSKMVASYLSMIESGCAVGPSDDLEEMPVRILKVHAATAVIVVDLARATPARVSPIVNAALTDPGEDLIELGFSDQEGVMLRHYLVSRLIEVETHSVAQLDYPERAEAGGVE
jgi:hypothetical protein